MIYNTEITGAINSFSNTNDIIKFLFENHNLVPKYEKQIIKKIRSGPFDNAIFNAAFLGELFTSDIKITRSDFNVVEALADVCKPSIQYVDNSLGWAFTLLSTPAKILKLIDRIENSPKSRGAIEKNRFLNRHDESFGIPISSCDIGLVDILEHECGEDYRFTMYEFLSYAEILKRIFRGCNEPLSEKMKIATEIKQIWALERPLISTDTLCNLDNMLNIIWNIYENTDAKFDMFLKCACAYRCSMITEKIYQIGAAFGGRIHADYAINMLIYDILITFDTLNVDNIGALYYKLIGEASWDTQNSRSIKAMFYACLDVCRIKYHDNTPVYKQIKNCLDTIFAYKSKIAAMEAYSKMSDHVANAEKRTYGTVKKIKDAEDKLDTRATKLVDDMKKLTVGDTRSQVIEGKKKTALGTAKKIIGTYAMLNAAPVKSALFLLVRHTLRRNSLQSERKKVLMELEAELEIINEKIDDARSNGDRDAKYAMMRSKTELENAIKKIRYGMEASDNSVTTAKRLLSRKHD